LDLEQFFEAVLPAKTGWTPIILKGPMGGLTVFKWFAWPAQKTAMISHVEANAGQDVYWSPFLYTEPPGLSNTRHATKENVTHVACVWADGDDCPLDRLAVQPSITVRTSEHHWQGYWLFDDAAQYPKETLEALSHGLYDVHADDGMDRGWPLSKKLRVPFTYNCKKGKGFPVDIEATAPAITVGEFAADYPPTERTVLDEEDMPVDIPSMFDVLGMVNRSFITDLATEDDFDTEDDRSAKMYHLQCCLWEEGASVVEAFAVVRETAFNKFAADGRGDTYLWKQVQRDHAKWLDEHSGPSQGELEATTRLGSSYLMSEARELQWQELSFLYGDEVEPDGTFVDMFAMWGATRSAMAPAQFHYAGALAVLSSLFAKYAYIPMNVQQMPLNLYFLVLGRTTQSRKSTSLRLAEGFMRDVAVAFAKPIDTYIAPEDSTGEALASYLREHARQSSVFAVDEVQDFFAQASTKGSYMTSMMSFLTKSYDGYIPAVARKDKGGKVAYQLQTPYYLTFYGTGILDQAAKHLTVERIESGFTPRCLVTVDDRDHYITSTRDVKLVPVDTVTGHVEDPMRQAILGKLVKAVRAFDTAYKARCSNRTSNEEARIPVMFDEGVFERWITFSEEAKVLASQHGLNSRELFPGTERLTFSVLKIAALLAMFKGPDRQGRVVVGMRHMLKAIALAPVWMASNEVFVHHVKNSDFSSKVDALINYVAKCNNGIVSIPKLMLKFQSDISGMRELKEIISYAQARGVIQEVIKGKKNHERFIKYTTAQ